VDVLRYSLCAVQRVERIESLEHALAQLVVLLKGNVIHPIGVIELDLNLVDMVNIVYIALKGALRDAVVVSINFALILQKKVDLVERCRATPQLIDY